MAEKYKDHGVVVIGVHFPEFAFEHDLENVRRAALVFLIFYGIDPNHRNAVGKHKTLRSKQNKEKEKFRL